MEQVQGEEHELEYEFQLDQDQEHEKISLSITAYLIVCGSDVYRVLPSPRVEGEEPAVHPVPRHHVGL